MMNEQDPIRSYYEGKVEPIYRAISGTALHLGMIEREGDSHEAGTARTKDFLASRLNVKPGELLIDVGSGYGDATQYLARRFDCRVAAVNLIHVQNVVALRSLRAAMLDRRVAVLSGDFGQVPLRAACAHAVWCQEALLHAPDRLRVLRECARVLQTGGQFILTDILKTGEMEPEEQRLIYARVQIESLESFDSYANLIAQVGLELVGQADLSRYVGPHYADLAGKLEAHRAELVEAIGKEYVDYTVGALRRWSQAGYVGKLGWGMFLAKKV